MCGFSGFWSRNEGVVRDSDAIIARMSGAIVHRGPDDHGAWSDKSLGIGFGFRRLSVVELSQAGHQPMLSGGGRFVIMFNGEVYNHMELRAELTPLGGWRGASDTETLLAGFESWGVTETLEKTVGMFAIALWDKAEKKLHLIRDRFGEKPLYYGWTGQGDNTSFLFGSELKSMVAFKGFNNPVSRDALTQYMRFTYVPAPYSIYKDVYKLEPGCMLTVDGFVPNSPSSVMRPGVTHDSIKIVRWWSLKSVVERTAGHPMGSAEEASIRLEESLSRSVKLQSIADVPLGAFLSGGVDSSTVVALMQKQSMSKVKTFTIGFEEASLDESPHAAAVAEHIGTDHHSLLVTSKQAQEVISLLPDMYDEPFADSSQIPTNLVSRLAKSHVTVSLSGDGGDELFGGYNRYFWGPRVWGLLSLFPFGVRRALGQCISKVPASVWDGLGQATKPLMPGALGVARLGDKAHNLARCIGEVQSMDDLYLSLVSQWTDESSLVKVNDEERKIEMTPSVSLLSDPLPTRGLDQSPLRMIYWDSMSYLSDDILCKVDRAAMSVSLETRIPFLDHRVVEAAWSMPLDFKIHGNVGKRVLRVVLDKYVPKELIDRPKAGFRVPVGDWLRGPLRDWAEALLNEGRLEAEGYFYSEPIQRVWREHLSGRSDHTPRLWTVLMFQAWFENQTNHLRIIH